MGGVRRKTVRAILSQRAQSETLKETAVHLPEAVIPAEQTPGEGQARL